jgi:hypothetical protein
VAQEVAPKNGSFKVLYCAVLVVVSVTVAVLLYLPSGETSLTWRLQSLSIGDQSETPRGEVRVLYCERGEVCVTLLAATGASESEVRERKRAQIGKALAAKRNKQQPGKILVYFADEPAAKLLQPEGLVWASLK